MRQKRKVLPAVLLVLLIVLIGAAATAAALFDNGQFEVILNGRSEIVLEYGQSYEDEGAYSLYCGVVNGDAVIDAQIKADGWIDPDVLGTYRLTYRSQYYWHMAAAVRTIRIVDTQKPTIVLVHNSDSYTLPGHEYEEEGFRAEDNYDGDITAKVERRVEGDAVIYSVTDSSGNTTEVTRSIKYGDFTAPELTLLGDETITVQAGTEFADPGYTAVDNVDGDVTPKVQVTGQCDVYTAGTYTIAYTVTDNYGNTAEKIRTVIVEPRKQPDVVDPDSKVIYLTFDDGPGPHTERLLEILGKYNVKATFFVVDTWYTYLLPQIVQAGHSIGIHSATHEYSQIYTSEAAFFDDLHTMENIIFEKTGIRTTLMRFPGGSSNSVSKKYCTGIMTALTKSVKDQGYQYFDWNVSSGDAGGAKTADEVFDNVVRGVTGKKTAVVLQHDIKDFSVDAVERIIQWGLANGYVFMPLEPNSPNCHHSVYN